MATKTEADVRVERVDRCVILRGITDLMFDRYAGDNQTKLNWDQKIYLVPGTSKLCMPAMNIVSFLSAHNTNSAPKRLRDARQFKKIANACLSFVSIAGPKEHPQYIPILRNGEVIEVGTFNETHDPKSGIYLHRSVARLDKGIPNPKERPTLPAPWEIEFRLSVYPNKEIKEQDVKNLISEGGLAIGLGTFRGVFGKFEIARWE